MSENYETGRADELNRRAQEFAKDYKALIERYYGQMEAEDFEPFAMRLRQLLPTSDLALGDRVTTTKTISLPLDTDPADQDATLSLG
jgi:hypothetical protein